jgi:hypothetical protein
VAATAASTASPCLVAVVVIELLEMIDVDHEKSLLPRRRPMLACFRILSKSSYASDPAGNSHRFIFILLFPAPAAKPLFRFSAGDHHHIHKYLAVRYRM